MKTRIKNTHTLALLLPFLLLALPAAQEAFAGSSKRFVIDTESDFATGKLEGVSLNSFGTLESGFKTVATTFPPSALSIHATLHINGTRWFGAQEGKVYRQKASETEIKEVATVSAMMVSSLAAGPNGTVFAGTVPEGRIYLLKENAQGQVSAEEWIKINGADPTASVHVWGLAYDARAGQLLVATGPQGTLFAIKVTPTRKPTQTEVEVWYTSANKHLLTLVEASRGSQESPSWLVGTSDEAHLLRVTGKDRVELVYDFDGTEITCIRTWLSRGQQVIAVCANEFSESPASGSGPSRSRNGKGRLWTNHAGQWEKIFSVEDGHFSALDGRVSSNGELQSLFVGHAQEGKVFEVFFDRSTRLALDADERSVAAISLSDQTVILGDNAKLYRILDERNSDGTWTSKVLDAGHRARFGQLAFRKEGRVRFQTRTGNTLLPDASWSAWSSVLEEPGPIRSPQGRYVQIKVSFSGDANAKLFSLTAHYLPENQRALVGQVTVAVQESGDARINWTVDNPDEDKLRYGLVFRYEPALGSTSANGMGYIERPVHPESEPIHSTEYTWKLSALAEGHYRVGVIASDEGVNPAPLFHTHQCWSESFVVDHHAPTLEMRQEQGKIVGQATDSMSEITAFEYAIDGGEWKTFFSSDDLFDTPQESFALDVSHIRRGHASGAHIVSVRTSDAHKHMTTRELVVQF